MSLDGDSSGALAAAGGASAQRAQRAAMERFLAEVEKRAYQHALLGLRHREDALDAVQDAMLQLCLRYADRPSAEWRPLFFRILVNKVQDQRRRRTVRGRWLAWWTPGNAEDDGAPLDLLDTTPDTRYRVNRGGSWSNDGPSWMRAASRGPDVPANRLNAIGFRCALPVRQPR